MCRDWGQGLLSCSCCSIWCRAEKMFWLPSCQPAGRWWAHSVTDVLTLLHIIVNCQLSLQDLSAASWPEGRPWWGYNGWSWYLDAIYLSWETRALVHVILRSGSLIVSDVWREEIEMWVVGGDGGWFVAHDGSQLGQTGQLDNYRYSRGHPQQ